MTAIHTPRLLSPHALARPAPAFGAAADTTAPIDGERWFVCPTLTPLYYTRIYHELSEPQRLRYNQLTALCFNELIGLFERTFIAAVEAAGARLSRENPAMAHCLNEFAEDERAHIERWRELSRRSAPGLYGKRDDPITRVPRAFGGLLAAIARRPRLLPVSFWLALALEEHSIDISRRCLRMDAAQAEPTYRAAYAQHLHDEARHVQLDRYLIERFYASLPEAWRRVNAKMLAHLIGRCFLPPNRSAVRVVRLLAQEIPALRPLLPRMVRELRGVSEDPGYHAMMYSRRSTPMLFSLFDRFPEMHMMRRVLQCYDPPTGDVHA